MPVSLMWISLYAADKSGGDVGITWKVCHFMSQNVNIL